MDDHAQIKEKIDSLVIRARSLLSRAAPGPWHESDSGYVTDDEGYIIAHLTPRRGGSRWDWQHNPNAQVIAESRQLLEDLADALEALGRALEIAEEEHRNSRRIRRKPTLK